MKKAYFKIFWTFLALVIILNEVIVSFYLDFSFLMKFVSILLVLVWSSVAIQNVYSYLYSKKA